MKFQDARTYKEFEQKFSDFIEDVHEEVKDPDFIKNTLKEVENYE